MAIGIGIVIACLLLLPFSGSKNTPGKIEKEARKMGMIYPDEIKALEKNKGGK